MNGLPARPQSLVGALFGRMGAVFAAVVLAVGLATFFTAQARINEIYDGQLIVAANVLRALMSEELSPPSRSPVSDQKLAVDDSPLLSAEDRRAFDAYAEWRMFRVWRQGRLTMQSDTGPPATATPPAQDGFSEVVGPRGLWRLYTLEVPARAVFIQVGERRDIRLVLVRRIALGLALPLLILLPVTGLLIWLALRGGLEALRALLGEMGRRSVHDLSPLSSDGWPPDLYPLIQAINGLFERIERAVQQERRFLDDAAHQLRTPLAAVKLLAQMIGGEEDADERRILVGQLTDSVDRAAAMTDSLLTLASLEARNGSGDEADLRGEAVAAIAELAGIAATRQVTLSFEGEAALVAGDPVLLRLITTNLLDNAIAHAPVHSEVTVRLWKEDGFAVMAVSDAGPGIAPKERSRAVQRFYTAGPAAGKRSGLGLSIVVEALRLLGGRLDLEDRPDGRAGLHAVVRTPTAK